MATGVLHMRSHPGITPTERPIHASSPRSLFHWTLDSGQVSVSRAGR